jgi:GDP-mannose pyrophosphatase NudK
VRIASEGIFAVFLSVIPFIEATDLTSQRNEVLSVTALLEGWSRVIRVMFRQRMKDGTSVVLDRDLLHRGDGVTVLLYNSAKRTVLLLRQPRIVATMTGHPTGETVEACNGMVGDESPEECALREVEEETGHRLTDLQFIGKVYASPGGSLELIHLFLGNYDDSTLHSKGGGLNGEGEDIEVIEVGLEQAMQWVTERAIMDSRTIIVLQFLYIRDITAARPQGQ